MITIASIWMAIAVMGIILCIVIKPKDTTPTILGIKIHCNPPALNTHIDEISLKSNLQNYATHMAIVFKVTPQAILDHYKMINCYIQNDFLTSHTQADTPTYLVGICLGSTKIRIALLGPEHPYVIQNPIFNMLSSGTMIAAKTAIFRELHNAMIYRFKGRKTALAESYVNPNNKLVQQLLGVSKFQLGVFKKLRKRYDLAFEQWYAKEFHATK